MHNVGKVDQTIRIILGTAFIVSLVFNFYPQHQTLVGVLGVYLIMSGYGGTCLIYHLLKINTTLHEKDKFEPEELHK